jgi:hypothetical protein
MSSPNIKLTFRNCDCDAESAALLESWRSGGVIHLELEYMLISVAVIEGVPTLVCSEMTDVEMTIHDQRVEAHRRRERRAHLALVAKGNAPKEDR